MALKLEFRNFRIPSLRGFEKRGSNLYKNPPTCLVSSRLPGVILGLDPRMTVLGNSKIPSLRKFRHCEALKKPKQSRSRLNKRLNK